MKHGTGSLASLPYTRQALIFVRYRLAHLGKLPTGESVNKPLIVICGAPDWAESLLAHHADVYTWHLQSTTDGYMSRLIDGMAALVVVHEQDDWGRWSRIPKSSPATRRIPILLVSEQAEHRQSAHLSGIDHVLSRAEWLANPLEQIQKLARLPDPEQQQRLDCDCQAELPAQAREAIQQFNQGDYYRQHDLFEALWMETASPVRDLYRAILQVGIAYYQIERGNYRGALKMLQRSVQWLVILPDVCQTVDVAQLRTDAFAVRAELEQLGEENFHLFDKSRLGKVNLRN